ncbi:MAG TPA: hypothetical protein PLR18_04410, partial [bacterium]|nr:hypothetical protein [bacterium]
MKNPNPTKNFIAYLYLTLSFLPSAVLGLAFQTDTDHLYSYLSDYLATQDQLIEQIKTKQGRVLGETLFLPEETNTDANLDLVNNPVELNTVNQSALSNQDESLAELGEHLSQLENKLVDPDFLSALQGEKGDPGPMGPAGPVGSAGSSASNSGSYASIPSIQYIYGNTIAQNSADPHNVTSLAAMNLSGETLVVKKADIGEWADIGGTLTVAGITTLNNNLNVTGTASFSGGLAISGSATIPNLNASTTIIDTLTVTGTLNQSGGSFTGSTTTVSGNFSVQDADGNVRVYVDNNTGSTGVATSTPGGTYGEKLTVAGSGYYTGGLYVDGLFVNLQARIATLNATSSSFDNLTVNTAAILNGLTAVSDGRIAVLNATSSTIDNLTVNTAINFPAGSLQAGDLALTEGYILTGNASNYAEATSSIFVAENGNVGIGTASPGAKLEISTVNTNGAIAEKLTVSADTDGDYVYGNYNVVNTGSGTLATGERESSGVYNDITVATNVDNDWNYWASGYGLFNKFNITGEGGYGYGIYNIAYQGDSVATYASLTGMRNYFNPDNIGSGATLRGSDNSIYLENLTTGTATAYGVYNDFIGNGGGVATLYGIYSNMRTNNGDMGYAYYVGNGFGGSTGGTQYGLYSNFSDTDVTYYPIYEANNFGNNILYANTRIGSTVNANNTLSVTGNADFTGSVGIATTTPYAKLSVVSDDYNLPKFMVASSTGFTTPSLYVASNGNVGIGTTAPLEKLAVQGNISVSGNLLPQVTGGKIPAVTVDATGIVGYYSSLALGTDGFARIAYSDRTNADLKFAQCTNADCST